MNDKRVGRINHADHDHPQTAHFKRLCREQMLADGEPLVSDGTRQRGDILDAFVSTPDPLRRTRKKAAAKNGRKRKGVEAPLTRGQKAAATRAKNRAAAEQAAAVDQVMDLTHEEPTDDSEFLVTVEDEPTPQINDRLVMPHRSSSGRFTRDTLNTWTTLMNSLDGVCDYLVTEGAGLLEARLVTEVGGRIFVATYTEDNGWAVVAED